jgi:UDP-glucose 4-epimerase
MTWAGRWADLAGLRCLVLGGGGFLGKSLTRALCAAGAKPAVFSRGEAASCDGSEATWIRGDFRDPAAVGQALSGCEVVFHLVSGTTPGVLRQDLVAEVLINILPTIQLLGACAQAGVRKVVYVSSGGAVYGIPKRLPIPESAETLPITAYGAGKLMIEQALALHAREHQLQYQVLRVSNPYGPGQSPFRQQGVVSALMYRAIHGLPLEIWGDGDVVRDFIHVDDVTAALLDAVRYNGPHRVMNVGSGQGMSINQVACDVEARLGRTLPRVMSPGRRSDVPVNVLDISLITGETSWRPEVSWMAGLHDTAEWLRRAY